MGPAATAGRMALPACELSPHQKERPSAGTGLLPAFPGTQPSQLKGGGWEGAPYLCQAAAEGHLPGGACLPRALGV